MELSSSGIASHCLIVGEGMGRASQGMLCITRVYSGGATLVHRCRRSSAKVRHPCPSTLAISLSDLYFFFDHHSMLDLDSVPH